MLLPYRSPRNPRFLSLTLAKAGGRDGSTAGEPSADGSFSGLLVKSLLLFWVVLVSTVKELNSSYYSGETILITVFAHYGNLL